MSSGYRGQRGSADPPGASSIHSQEGGEVRVQEEPRGGVGGHAMPPSIVTRADAATARALGGAVSLAIHPHPPFPSSRLLS